VKPLAFLKAEEVDAAGFPLDRAAFQCCIVMELGIKNLLEHINGSNQMRDFNHQRAIAFHLVKSLMACHDYGIVLIDFKLSNVVSFHDEIEMHAWRLIDFDSALHVGQDLPSPRESIGTLETVAPELLAIPGKRFKGQKACLKADSWSYSMVIITIFCNGRSMWGMFGIAGDEDEILVFNELYIKPLQNLPSHPINSTSFSFVISLNYYICCFYFVFFYLCSLQDRLARLTQEEVDAFLQSQFSGQVKAPLLSFLRDTLVVDPAKRKTLKEACDMHSLFKGGITQGSSALYAAPQSKDIQDLTKIMSGIQVAVEGVKQAVYNADQKIDNLQADVSGMKNAVQTLGDNLSRCHSDLDEALDSAQREHDSSSTLLQQILQLVQVGSDQQAASQSNISLPQLLSEMQGQLQQSIDSAVSLASAETKAELEQLQEKIQQGVGALREAAADGHAETREQLAVAVGSVQLRLNQIQVEVQSEVADAKKRADQAFCAQELLVQQVVQEVQRLQTCVNAGQTELVEELDRQLDFL